MNLESQLTAQIMSEKAPAEFKMIMSQSSKYKTCYINFTVYLHLFFGILFYLTSSKPVVLECCLCCLMSEQ